LGKIFWYLIMHKLNKKQESCIEEYNDKILVKFKEVESEAVEIQRIWFEQVQSFKCAQKTLKLVIWGEAPLSSKKYFYHNPGNFLKGISDFFKVNGFPNISKENFTEILVNHGILLIDIYRFPLPSEIYKKHHEIYFDVEFLEKQLALIQELIDEDTKFIFRFKMLSKRKYLIKQFDSDKFNSLIRFIRDDNCFTPLFTEERPTQKLNLKLKKYFTLKNEK